jgi:RNA polymerase sigma factor (TIGR02999 family)
MLGPHPPGLSQDDSLVEAIYHQLRCLARRRLQREPATPTLQATALVHEAWMRLDGAFEWQSAEHYYNAAALAMRRILVDRARRRSRERHGGTHARVPIELADDVTEEQVDALRLDGALDRLAELDPRAYQVVQLRFLAGLSVEETARVTGLSARTVKREWSTARLWLFDELRGDEAEA